MPTQYTSDSDFWSPLHLPRFCHLVRRYRGGEVFRQPAADRTVRLGKQVRPIMLLHIGTEHKTIRARTKLNGCVGFKLLLHANDDRITAKAQHEARSFGDEVHHHATLVL